MTIDRISGIKVSHLRELGMRTVRIRRRIKARHLIELDMRTVRICIVKVSHLRELL